MNIYEKLDIAEQFSVYNFKITHFSAAYAETQSFKSMVWYANYHTSISVYYIIMKTLEMRKKSEKKLRRIYGLTHISTSNCPRLHNLAPNEC